MKGGPIFCIQNENYRKLLEALYDHFTQAPQSILATVIQFIFMVYCKCGNKACGTSPSTLT